MPLVASDIPQPARRRQPEIPAAVLASVAEHCREAGTCLIILDREGGIIYRDPAVGPFFTRYVLPLLSIDPTASELRRHVGLMTAQSPAATWDLLPGVLLSAIPFAHRRQVEWLLLLAARSETFRLDERVRAACDRVKLDPGWLHQTATGLLGRGPRGAAIDAALFLKMINDRARLACLERELDSLSTQLANAYEELTLIDQVSGEMRINRGVADFFRQACLDVMQVLAVRGMGVILRPEIEPQSAALYGEVELAGSRLEQLGQQLLATLRQRQGPLLINDLATDRDYGWLIEHATRLIAVPLQRGEQVLGCFFGLDKTAGDFDSVDSKLLGSIANESAIYLENARLFGDVHDLMMSLLRSLTSAVDAKDAYTCGHSERVALLGRYLAVQIGLSPDEVEQVYMAGLLHDVGKIGVPESVLQKAGRLTSEEFEIIKKHPRIGARILADVKQLERIVPGVLHHHERFDGHGYPDGLTAEEIPLIGRIICLADCFDAITSNRTYRKALPLEVALGEIRRCAGTQFDPVLAESFLGITNEQFQLLMRDHESRSTRLMDLQEILRAA